MITGLFNRDSSFFTLESADLSSGFKILEDDIISFSIEEEFSKILTGSLSIYDPNHFYSKMFRQGLKFKCSWGYKTSDKNPKSLLSMTDKSQFIGRGYRQNVTGIVQSPSGSADESGQIVYNINFHGWEVRTSNEQRVYTTGNKSSVIREVMSRMGITMRYIKFKRGNESITPITQPIQYETDFKFLIRCAYEWGAVFKVGENQAGITVGLFAEYDTIEMKAFTTACGNLSKAGSLLLNYKADPCNVRSYSWQNRMGLDGSGDNVQIVMGANGQPQFYKYIAETQTVQTWKLRPDKIRDELARRTDIKSKTAVMKDWLGAQDFEQVKWAFELSTDTTAPQGLGYTISAKMVGNPHVTSGVQAMFGEPIAGIPSGFPAFCYTKLGMEKTKWWTTKVKHQIDRSGYNMDVDIADAFTINNGSFI